jgi:hypothetical protein
MALVFLVNHHIQHVVPLVQKWVPGRHVSMYAVMYSAR